jgi:DNA replication protein DnaC
MQQDRKQIKRTNSQRTDSVLEKMSIKPEEINSAMKKIKSINGAEFCECRNPACGIADYPSAFVDGLCYQCKPQFDIVRRLSNPDERLMTFDVYNVTKDNAVAFKKAKAFIDSKTSLFFSGKAGRGKTHLLVASYIESIRRCCRSEIVYVTNWNHVERISYETQGEAEKRIVDRALSCDILYMDDLIPIKVTDGLKEMLYLVFDTALKKKRPKIFATSNKGISYISSTVDDRIASRLGGLIGNDNDIVFPELIDDHRLKGKR